MELTRWEKIAGSFFYIGFSSKGPGTVTSLLVFAAAWFADRNILTGVLLLFLPLGFYLAYRLEKCLGQDPSAFTLDEVTGSLIVLICIPHDIYYYLAFFIVWRLLDIFKPLFRKVEQIPQGIGIMLDDIIAAVLTAGIYYGFAWIS